MPSIVNNKRIVKNSLFLSLRMAVVMIISIFTTRYLIANLGIEDYGVYNVTLGVVAMCTFLNPALSNANQRFHNFELGKNGLDGGMRVFNSGLQMQLLMVVLIILICETLGLWYVKEKLVIPSGREDVVFWIFQISILGVSVSMLQIPFISAILAHEKMNFYAIVNVMDALLKFVIAICIAFSSYDHLLIYGILLLSINILNFVLYSCYSFRNFEEISIKTSIHKDTLLSMLSFSGWNLFETVARIGKDQGGNLLLNFFFGPVLNAARGITNQVTYAFTSVVESTVMASRPQMVNAYAQGQIDISKSMFISLSKGVLFIIFLLSLPVFLEIDFILHVWLGDNIPDYSAELIKLSILIILVDKLASPVTALVHATGKVKHYHLVSSLVNISVIPFSYVLLKFGLGPESVYLATFLCALIAQFLFLFEIKRLIVFSPLLYLKTVLMPFLSIVIIASAIPLLCIVNMEYGIVRFVVVFFSSVIIGGLSIYWIGLSSQEKKLLLSIVKR